MFGNAACAGASFSAAQAVNCCQRNDLHQPYTETEDASAQCSRGIRIHDENRAKRMQRKKNVSGIALSGRNESVIYLPDRKDMDNVAVS